MAGRNTRRGSGAEPGRDAARREQERQERAARRAEKAAAEAEQQAAREARRPAQSSDRAWTDGEWDAAGSEVFGAEPPSFAAPATRAGQERQRAFAPLAPADAPRRRGRDGGAAVDDPPPAAAAAGDAPHRAREHQRRRGAAKAPREGGTVALAAPLAAAAATASAFVSARRLPVAGAALAVIVIGALLTLGGGSGTKPKSTASSAAAARQAAEARWAKSRYGVPTKVVLPPKTRIVAYAGAPKAKALGILGTLPFKQAAAKLKNQSSPYARPTRHVLRAYDLIATVASASPGPSGKYRTRQPPSVIARYLRAARRDHATLILDIQPGQSNFVDEIKPLERWLKEPDVQLALDPEWRMRPGVVPGSEIGYVSGGELNAALARVGAIIKAGHLPNKMVLVHRFTDGMIKNFAAVRVPKGIVGVISIDGVGAAANKEATYNKIAPTLPKPWLPGFKLFYQEDAKAGGLMSGKQVMGLTPRPHVVLYE